MYENKENYYPCMIYILRRSRSVVVITSASHAEGPWFEPSLSMLAFREKSHYHFLPVILQNSFNPAKCAAERHAIVIVFPEKCLS
ncbi:hypothetical protein T4B_3266 [Trichinella pseudospiralis]|uniref:Uncharacterized protein n=1 Tax=Trichinella pseudospiralis TaxID=6337 RepID=A0A0V1HGQ7_TRIPS|nr:hypothetical protein T4A_5232 [Trichinella pseudospiralis]KRZ09944.1 hypothetical protein T4B_3266 [Trichinella pseudospiralis]KRZ43162.1 hypothetical protein T4C_3701 [Trichinella pseudospiralis]